MRTPDAISDPRDSHALALMLDFADRTGLTSDGPPDRYLWTDAFAVCNFLGLGRADLALRLVEQVHRTLGRHRQDDPRQGWLSGLEGESAGEHPTAGGLRIGKPFRERRVDEPFDERLEWDREGQYFHYLTKWMHALDQVARWTRDATFNIWARELAEAAHRTFVYRHDGGRIPRMYWKMSVDLSRPLVASMGHHDPLDGYVTALQLETTALSLAATDRGPRLFHQIADFAAMIPVGLTTSDPLGLGGLLADRWRLEQLADEGAPAEPDLRDRLIHDSLLGLGAYLRGGEPGGPATERLAFRELGLAIGLAAVPHMRPVPEVERLARFVPLRDAIESFWLEPDHRRVSTWLDHRNINEVMLATSLAPDGYLTLRH
jgi:hypothetical protein